VEREAPPLHLDHPPPDRQRSGIHHPPTVRPPPSYYCRRSHRHPSLWPTTLPPPVASRVPALPFIFDVSSATPGTSAAANATLQRLDCDVEIATEGTRVWHSSNRVAWAMAVQARSSIMARRGRSTRCKVSYMQADGISSGTNCTQV
jgi:hypothetical protein